MRLRFLKNDEFQFLTCLKDGTLVSSSEFLEDCQVGEFIVFVVDKTIAGLAKVSGEFYSPINHVGENNLSSFCIPLKFTHAFHNKNRLKFQEKFPASLISAWGSNYERENHVQKPIHEDFAKAIINTISINKNDLSGIRAHIEQYLDRAKMNRDSFLIQIAIQLS